jgi:hypothetical protein
MKEKRGRGRPKKVGKWKYYIKTGAQWGNLGTAMVWNHTPIVKDTDTECKRAAQKFFESFHKNARRFGSLDEQGALDALIMELDGLREAQSAWEVDSFEGGPLYFEWKCAWGDQGDFRAAVEITRAKAQEDIKQGGVL